MVFLPFTKMFERLENSKQESDSAYFLDLLYCGEMITKTIISGMISSVIDDKNRNRYRLSHRVVRADGIGEWSSVLDDLLTGLASQFLDSDVRMNEMHELTVKSDTGTWQYESVNNLLIAMKSIGDNTIEIPKKIQAKIWFLNFAKLRNSTRGHGALLPGEYKDACIPLENSIKLIVNNFYLFKRQWAFLYENISGKYRVTSSVVVLCCAARK